MNLMSLTDFGITYRMFLNIYHFNSTLRGIQSLGEKSFFHLDTYCKCLRATFKCEKMNVVLNPYYIMSSKTPTLSYFCCCLFSVCNDLGGIERPCFRNEASRQIFYPFEAARYWYQNISPELRVIQPYSLTERTTRATSPFYSCPWNFYTLQTQQ